MLIQKSVAVPASVDTVVKSVVDLAGALKSGASLGALVDDLVADIQAVPSIMADLHSNPFESANSIALGLISVAKILVTGVAEKKLDVPMAAV